MGTILRWTALAVLFVLVLEATARAEDLVRYRTPFFSRIVDEAELSDGEAGRDTFSGDLVVLDDFVREFILLELPAYPRRSDLPSPGDAASAPAPEPAGIAAIDPRLRPLADIAQRLASKKAKE